MSDNKCNICESLGNGEIKLIPLTKGKFAIVDADDFERLAKHKWHVHKGHHHNLYAVRNSCGKGKKKRQNILMHREVLNLLKGESADHRNNYGLDNRKCNLRVATRSENKLNSRSYCGASKYKGVTFHKKSSKWRAQLTINKQYHHLGCFSTEEEAALAYDKAALTKAGVFARLNFPDRTILKIIESIL